MSAPIHARLSVTGLLLLTASTGIVDAVSYLALDRVFTGNMTGNVLFLGFAAMGVGGIPFLNNLIALAGFVLGSIMSGRVVGRGHATRSFPRRSVVVLAIVAVAIAALGVVWAVLGTLEGPVMLVVTALLALVMGAQVTAVKPIGNSEITTIVVTNTIANLARESRMGGGTGERWLQRVLAVLSMGAGAAIGALAVRQLGGAAGLGASAVVIVGALLVLALAGRRPARSAGG